MNIDGRERNSQIDEAYLLLRKTCYDQRFIPVSITYCINTQIVVKYMKQRRENQYAFRGTTLW
jgi:hypothetical protein